MQQTRDNAQLTGLIEEVARAVTTEKMLECGVDISTPEGILAFQSDLRMLRAIRKLVEEKMWYLIAAAFASGSVALISAVSAMLAK